jgi:hypothetical protein
VHARYDCTKKQELLRFFIAWLLPDFCISLLPEFRRQPEPAEAIAICGWSGSTLRVIRYHEKLRDCGRYSKYLLNGRRSTDRIVVEIGIERRSVLVVDALNTETQICHQCRAENDGVANCSVRVVLVNNGD